MTTPPGPGAIALLWLEGDVEPVLAGLTTRPSWPVGTLALARLADVDDGLVSRPAARTAMLMPHGGPRIVQRIAAALATLGVTMMSADDVDPRTLYPEATDDAEAWMLAALARVHSPLAIELLLRQPARWRAAPTATAEDTARAQRLRHLIDPPAVVLVGPANVGKSTLTNTLLGRTVSITLDEPGTTRDATAALVDLAGLVVWWHDTPGVHETDDPSETHARALAARLEAAADLLIAVTDAHQPWPSLARAPGLRVGARADLGSVAGADVCVCAPRGEGLERLARAIRDRLVAPEDLAHPGPWRFAPALAVPGAAAEVEGA